VSMREKVVIKRFYKYHFSFTNSFHALFLSYVELAFSKYMQTVRGLGFKIKKDSKWCMDLAFSQYILSCPKLLGLVNGNWPRSIDSDTILGFYIISNSCLQNRLVRRGVSLYRPYLYSMCMTSFS